MASVALLLSMMLPMVACVCPSGEHLKCSNVTRGHVGQRSVLNCVFEIPKQKIQILVWKKDNAKLLEFYYGIPFVEKGYVFIDPLWINGKVNVSLIIEKTTLDDNGEFTVKVEAATCIEEATVTLTIVHEPTVLVTTPASPPEDPERYQDNQPVHVVAPLVVIGSIIVGLLLVLLYKKRAESRHMPVNTNESPEDSV